MTLGVISLTLVGDTLWYYCSRNSATSSSGNTYEYIQWDDHYEGLISTVFCESI